MHLPAIAHEFGIEIDADTFDRMHRGAHYLLNIRPSGDWPAQYFYYAGGVPRVMEEIKSMLHLDVMTVTGKTLGENLEDLKKNGFYEHCDEILQEKTKGLGIKVTREDIIHSFDNAKGTDGSIAILGDITQIDLPRSTKSGLRHAIEVLAEVDEISFNFFHSEDVVRHPVVARIVNAYEAWEAADQKRKAELAAERKREAQEQEQK